MKKSLIRFLICGQIYSLSLSTYAQEILVAKVVDSETGSSIPFTYIRIKGEKKVTTSDEDGYFKLLISSDDTLEFSHVAYRPLSVPLKGIRNNYVFRLEELPVSITPIVVSVNWAEKTLLKALKLTFKEIKAPAYLKCYRNDKIIFNGTKVRESVSESDVKIKFLLSPSNGAIHNIYLRNVMNYCNDSMNIEIPEYLIPNNIPINNFLIGVSEKVDKRIYFYSQEVNDSIMIISYKPHKGQEYLKNSTITRGRFFIDRISGRFFRIDCEVDEDMWAHQRELSTMRDSLGRFYYRYYFSMILDKNAFPSEVEIEYSFSYGKDDPKSMWQNRCKMRLSSLKDQPDLSDKSKFITKDSLFVNMTSSFDKQFEKNVNSIFK